MTISLAILDGITETFDMTNDNNTGWRETGDSNGFVMHFRVGASVLCRTRGAKAATMTRKEVNCTLCLTRIARIFGQKETK
jgi:hypothetical protein